LFLIALLLPVAGGNGYLDLYKVKSAGGRIGINHITTAAAGTQPIISFDWNQVGYPFIHINQPVRKANHHTIQVKGRSLRIYNAERGTACWVCTKPLQLKECSNKATNSFEPHMLHSAQCDHFGLFIKGGNCEHI